MSGELNVHPTSENLTKSFISDFHELDKQMVYKHSHIPIISKVLQKLHVFQWATVLDLINGYYSIKLNSDDSSIHINSNLRCRKNTMYTSIKNVQFN